MFGRDAASWEVGRMLTAQSVLKMLGAGDAAVVAWSTTALLALSPPIFASPPRLLVDVLFTASIHSDTLILSAVVAADWPGVCATS